MKNDSIIIEYQPVGPFAMNSYLLGCRETGEAAVIDSGGEAELFMELAEKNDLTIKHLLQTHGHVDHVAGLQKMKQLSGAPIYLHPDDRPVYDAAVTQGRFFGFPVSQPPAVDIELKDGQIIEIGNIRLEVLHTPGHCPGHVCYYDADDRFMFSGDLLFQGSIGRTDLPGGDTRLIRASLDRLLRNIPAETAIFPGHMGPTTMEQEKRTNPFLSGLW